MRVRLLVRAALLWLLAAGTAPAKSDDLEFAQALRKRGYVDFAVMQLQRMKESKSLSKAEKACAMLEMADLYEETARNEAGTVKKEGLLKQSTDELALFLSTAPEHELASETHYKRAQLLMSRGSLLADVMQSQRDAKAKKGVLAQAVAVYEDARKEANLAAKGYEGATTKAGGRKKSGAGEAKVRMLDALLLDPWIMYSSAKLHQGTANYNKTLAQTLKKFEEFAQTYKGLDRTLVAHRGQGLCYFRMKKYEEAKNAYRKIIRTRPISATDQIRQLAYYSLAECYNAWGKYSEAITTVSKGLEREWPDLFKDRDPVGMAAKLEEAKALVALAKRSKGRAASLRKQRKNKEAANEEKQAERRVNDAVKTARAVAGMGGVWGRTANALLSEWLKLLKKAPERTAQEAFAEAEALYKTNKLPAAVVGYREVILSADMPKQKQIVIQAWLKLGACYFRLQRAFEAALCLGHVPRTFGARSVQADWAFVSLSLFSKIYEKEKTKYAAARYLDALQFFGRNYPKHPMAAEMQFLAAEISRDQSKYGDAAKDYGLVAPVNERYQRAAYLAGFCNWLEFLRIYEGDKKKATPYAKAAETVFTRFLKWAEELPRIQPERVEESVEWVAKTKVDLAELYVHEAVKKWAEAAAVLADFTKTYPKYRDLFAKHYYTRIRAYAGLGELPEAEKALALMVKDFRGDENTSMSARLIGRGYFRQWEKAGKTKPLADKAAKYLAMVVAVKPDHGLGDYLWIGSTLVKVEKHGMARDIFKSAIARFEPKMPDSNEIYILKRKLAESYLALRDFAGALALVQEAVKREPDVISFRKDLAMCYEKSGRWADALPAWRKVASMAREGDADWHYAKAKVVHTHLALKNPTRAFEMLVLTYEFYPDWGAKVSSDAAALYKSAIDKLPEDRKKEFAQIEAERKKQAGE